MRIHRLTMVSAVVAGLASLGYTMAYIGRWEWQRAQLAADLTLLCAILVLGLVIDARTRDLPGRRKGGPRREDRPGSSGGPARSVPELLAPNTGGQVRPLRPPSAATPQPPVSPRGFAWLSTRSDTRTERYGVFIPLLLGAGMAASGMAWVLERMSGLFAGRSAAGTGRGRGALPRPELPVTLLVPADTRLGDVLVGFDASDPAELWLRGPVVPGRSPAAATGLPEGAEEAQP